MALPCITILASCLFLLGGSLADVETDLEAKQEKSQCSYYNVPGVEQDVDHESITDPSLCSESNGVDNKTSNRACGHSVMNCPSTNACFAFFSYVNDTVKFVVTVFLGVVGLLLVILGVLVAVLFDPMVNSFIFKELVIRNNSDVYKKWKDPPVVPHLQVYFFNVTNKEEFLEGSKPVFQEVGPYCYREKWKKVNISFYNNGSVSYETQKFYFFERSASVGSEDDLITTLNVPMMIAVSQWRFAARLAKLALSSMLEVLGTKPFVTKTVGQFMWGYDDPLLKIAKDIIPPDKRLPYEQFGFFIKRNGSTDGLLNVYTGQNDMSKYTTINTFNHMSELHYWKTDACNKIQGTDGSSFPPSVRKDSVLRMFNKNLCRSIPLVYWHDIKDFDIEGMRFTPPSDIFANVSVKPENDCYCSGGPPCIGGGVFNISSCVFGSPTLVSWPHFYQADAKYRDAVIGLSPDPDKHAMFIDIAPRTGSPLRAQARLQINIALPHVPEVHPAAKLREMIFPVLWFEDGVAELPVSLLDLLVLGENTPPVAKMSMLLATFAIGITTILFVVFIVFATHYDLPVPYFNPNYTHRDGQITKVNNAQIPAHKAHLSGHVKLWCLTTRRMITPDITGQTLTQAHHPGGTIITLWITWQRFRNHPMYAAHSPD